VEIVLYPLEWSRMKTLLCHLSFILLFFVSTSSSQYNVGIGRADITGPAAEVGMMGYAKQGQNTGGIHTRIYSRAFLIEDQETSTRVVFVSVDCAMMGQLVKKYVVDNLEKTYPGMYSERNIILSATHTHSVPAGFMQYILFNVPNLGYIEQTTEAMVEGITLSIVRAHEKLAPGSVFMTETDVKEQASINRSPTSYLANPEEERAKYASNLDTNMVQLNFYDEDDQPLGVLNWFSVHPNSMNNTNHYISGDNKGAASLMMEKTMNPDHLAGQSPFVAAFASTNLGDVSPNTDGPKCQDTGLECDVEHSTCDGRTQMCIAAGPGKDMFESTKIIAERQYRVANELLQQPPSQTMLKGPVQFIHQWVDMSKSEVTLANGTKSHTCKPALGYSFAAGTTDGPGEFDFTQGATTGNPFWDAITGLLKDPTPEQEECHYPKPILLDTGEYTLPFAWHPINIDTQIVRLGQLLILAVPGEFTTMAGRRLREAVAETAALEGGKVVIAGLSNTYTHYITTWEEYQKQRYEAASTIFGPNTLLSYQQQYVRLAEAMLAGDSLEPGTPPPDLSDQEISFVPGVILDSHPSGHPFGDCVIQPALEYNPGDTVSATFVSGHLRNNLMLEETFLTVERQEGLNWKVVARDGEWETKLLWTRTNVISGESQVEVIWDVPLDIEPGVYRLGHRGFHKTILRGVLPYEGWSVAFQVGSTQGIERIARARSSASRAASKLPAVWDMWQDLVNNLSMK